MALAIVNTPTPLNTTTGGATLTLSFQCNSGTDFLTVGISSYQTTTAGSAVTITSVTYNGVAMTYQTNSPYISAAEDTQIYTLIAPTTGSSQNLVINYSPNCPFGAFVQPLCWSGVDQTTPVGAKSSSASGTATSPVSDAITVASGNYALDQWSSGASALTLGAGQNSVFNAAWGGSRAATSYKQDATAMSVTFTSTQRVAHSWIEIKASGAGATNWGRLLGMETNRLVRIVG